MRTGSIQLQTLSFGDLNEEALRRRLKNHADRLSGVELDARRKESLAGWVCLSELLNKTPEAGLASQHEEEFYVELSSPNHFANISHTKIFSAAVISNSPIGVDVEELTRPVRNVLKKVATDEEQTWSEGPPIEIDGHAVDRKLIVWTAKEAAAKAIGTGWQVGGTNLKLSLQEGVPETLVLPSSGPFQVSDPVLHFEVTSEHLLAVCSERGHSLSHHPPLVFPESSLNS